ncbi:MAG TPA: pyruvate kinase, partial [bacterium]|nr:pyruvate kinase [bacterium]
MPDEAPSLETRAKVVCTLGPSSNSLETIRRMMLAGMNVTRHNFSHGTHADHRHLIETVRQAARQTGRIVAIMADLQGPKIRVGRFKDGQVQLDPGARFTITCREVEGTPAIVSTTYRELPRDVRRGDTVLLDDGLIQLRVTRVEDQDIQCEVVTGGVLSNNKGINLPGVTLSVG